MKPPIDPIYELPVWQFGDEGYTVYLGSCNGVVNPICLISDGGVAIVSNIGLTEVWRYDDDIKDLVTTSDYDDQNFGSNLARLINSNLTVHPRVEIDNLDIISLSYRAYESATS